jgi:hypothetical protein
MASKLAIGDRSGSDNFVPEMPAKLHRGSQVDFASAEQSAELLLHVAKTEESHALPWPELNQDVDVAGIREPIREHGTEERQLPNAVAATEVGDLGLRNLDLPCRHTLPIIAQKLPASGLD